MCCPQCTKIKLTEWQVFGSHSSCHALQGRVPIVVLVLFSDWASKWNSTVPEPSDGSEDQTIFRTMHVIKQKSVEGEARMTFHTLTCVIIFGWLKSTYLINSLTIKNMNNKFILYFKQWKSNKSSFFLVEICSKTHSNVERCCRCIWWIWKCQQFLLH